MGDDPESTIPDIDAFVDECITFLLKYQEDDDFSVEIFALEEARQNAILKKLK